MHTIEFAPLRRTVIASASTLFAAAVLVAGCSSGDSTSPPPPPQDVWNVVASRGWTIPGGTEGYKCYGAQATADENITGFRFASPSAAQAEVLLMVTDIPQTLGSFDCDEGTLSGHLVYAGSLGTTPITFPAGEGVHVAAGEYVLLNSHINNVSGSDVADSTRIEGRAGTAADVTTPLDMILAGSLQINLPSDGVTHTATGFCNVGSNEHFVALIPLMRSLAVHQTVSLPSTSDATPQPIFDAAFDPSHVLYSPFSPDLLVPAGVRLEVVCSYVNNRGFTVQFGESANDESCFTGIYHYPIGSANHFLDCAEGMSLDIRRGEM